MRQSLVAFHRAPDLVGDFEGDPQMRWLGVQGEPRRAFECAESCRIEVRAAEGRLEAVASVRPGSEGRRRFEVRGSDGSLLWSADLGAGESRGLRLPLPGRGNLELRIEAVEGSARALWLSPFLVTERVARPAAPGLPHVVLVTSDTTRQDELSVYGGPVATPALERLAAEGVVFDDAHAVAFGTNPSHASLMTSTHAARHGVVHNRIALGGELPTLAETLRDQGYATAAFVSAVVLTRRAGLARGFDVYDDSVGLERPGDLTVRLFARWLRERGGGPFFAWIHLYDPHQPYAPAGAPAAPEVDALIARTNRRGLPGFIDPLAIRDSAPDRLPDVERVARERYRAEIAFVDRQVASLRALLEERGLLDDTLFVFTADHGENFLDRGPDVAYNHAGVRGDVTRIPLIMRLPGAAVRGRSAALVGNLDLAPTIVSWLGLPPVPAWDGVPLLDPSGVVAREDLREHLVLEGSHRREVGVRTREWLYREIREPERSERILRVQGFAPDTPFELYEHASDPGETTNVYASGHPAVARLRALLERFGDASEAGVASGSEVMAIEPEHARALEALGYVEPAAEP